MGGPSKQQTQTYDQQDAFYQQLSNEYSQVYGQQQNALKELHSNLAPILNAGTGQQGFSDKELTSLNTTAKDQVATNFDQATRAIQGKFASQEGNVYVPQGAQMQLEGETANSAAGQLSSEQNDILQKGFAQGNANYWNAENALNGQAAMLNPNGTAGEANNAGSSVGTTANEITQSNNSWMNLVGGALGGIGGAALGKF